MEISLVSLTIRKFRGFAPTTLEFGKMTVLLGLNASGKTSLLNLIAAALDGDFNSFAESSLDISYTLRFESLTIEIDVAFSAYSESYTETPGARTKARTRTSPRKPRGLEEALPKMNRDLSSQTWEHTIKISHPDWPSVVVLSSTPGRVTVTGFDEEVELPAIAPTARGFLGHLLGRIVMANDFDFENAANSSLWTLAVSLTLGRNACGRFDESLGAFTKIFGATWRLIRDASGDWYPSTGDFALYDIAEALATERLAPTLERRAEGERERTFGTSMLPFLSKASTAMGFTSARMRLRTLTREADRITFGDPYFEFGLDEDLVSHELLSFGQKRLLSFYYYCSLTSVVVADEVANGMHYEWIRECIQMLSNKQAFLSSQNPVLLDALSFSCANDVRTTFVTCRRNGSHLFASNLEFDDAERFFRAYEVGFEHVSEILRSKRLW